MRISLKTALRLAKQAGYEGADTDTGAIVAHLREHYTSLSTEDGIEVDIKKVTVTADAGEEVEFVDASGEAEMEAESAKMDDEEEYEGEKSGKGDFLSKEIKELREEIKRLQFEAGRAKKSAGSAGRIHAAIAERKAPSTGKWALESKRYNRLASEGRAVFTDADQAREYLAFTRYHLFGVKMRLGYEGLNEDRAICQKANIVADYSLGGFTVPDQFRAELIDLREARGIARQVLDFFPADSNFVELPRRGAGVTVYNPAEGGEITESNPTGDTVGVNLKEMMALATVSQRLLTMSALNFADHIASEIEYAFADKEDDCLLNGDGTSTYFGITGIRTALTNLSNTIANIAGLHVASGNAYSEITLSDFDNLEALFPHYPDGGEGNYIVSKSFFGKVMQRLAKAGGGNTQNDIATRFPVSFNGNGVAWSSKMPRTEANSQVCALFGDFNRGVKAAESGSMRIDTSTEYAFNRNKVAIRGVQDVGITVHDVGNASATPASREAGPIVGLITAAS